MFLLFKGSRTAFNLNHTRDKTLPTAVIAGIAAVAASAEIDTKAACMSNI
jgi:hypothetical protein